MTKREFLDTVFALAPNEANAIMDAFDEYVDSNEPHWIPVTERLPEVKQRVIVQYADGSMAIKRCIDAGHLQWFYSNAVAWMPAPEPYKEVTT
jgi:hypothetical protein